MVMAYLKSRFNPVKFLLLAILLSLLVYSSPSPWIGPVLGIAFLFSSIFAFRVLDDAGSVHYDRVNHPNRSYLSPENFLRFLRFTIAVLLIYLAFLFAFSLNYFITGSLLLVLSFLAYILFGKNNAVLPIIPLLKYPVLLWVLMDFSLNPVDLCVASSSIFMMASYDLIEQIGKNKSSLLSSIITLLLTGILLFPFWLNGFQWLLILPMPLLVFVIGKWKYFKYLPLLFYPISYLILNQNF